MRDGKVIGVKVGTNILQMTGHIRIVSAVERGFEFENHGIRVISGLQGRMIVAPEYEGGKGERGGERRHKSTVRKDMHSALRGSWN